MMRLLRVELSRFRLRRAVVLLMAVAFVLPVLIGVGIAWDHRPVSDAEVAEAERMAEADTSQRWVRRELRDCVEHPRQYGVPTGEATGVTAACEEMVVPSPEWYLHRSELDIVEEFSFGSGLAVFAVVTVLLMLGGTTFAGHDWASGSMTNQLLFEPRRGRVWLAKAGAVGVAAALISTALLSSYPLALWLVAGAYDQAQPPGALLDALQFGWRGAALATAATVGAYAITMFFRSTVGTLGVIMVVGIAGGLLLSALGLEARWNPAYNAAAIVRDGVTYGASGPCGPEVRGEGQVCWVEKELTLREAVTYFGVLLAVAVALSLAAFRVRDV